MRKLRVDELFNVLRYSKGEFFTVQFERRTNSENWRLRAGDIRTMLCRTGVTDFKRGIVSDAERDAEDFRHGILTVFDAGWFISQLRDIAARLKCRINEIPQDVRYEVGCNSWRRIDLCGLRDCSLIGDEALPPKIVPQFHSLTNEWRLAHMPPTVNA